MRSWWGEIGEEALASFFRGVLLGRECGFDLDESDGQQASALAGTQRSAAGDGNQSGGQPLLP
jgi:hypothetical protein